MQLSYAKDDSKMLVYLILASEALSRYLARQRLELCTITQRGKQ